MLLRNWDNVPAIPIDENNPKEYIPEDYEYDDDDLAPIVNFKIVKKIIAPNDKATNKLFSLSEENFKEMIGNGKRIEIVEEKARKKTPEVITKIWLSVNKLIEELMPDRLDEFDRTVFNAIISEFFAGNEYTTPQRIYGLMSNNNRVYSDDLMKKICASIKKMRTMLIKIDMTEFLEKQGENFRKTHGFTKMIYEGYFLPAETIVGFYRNQCIWVLHFLAEPPLLKIAKMKNQLIYLSRELLTPPKTRATSTTVKVRNYLLKRVSEIKITNKATKKRVAKLSPTITFDDICRKIGLENPEPKQLFDIRKTAKRLLENLVEKGELKSYEFEKNGREFYGIKIKF